ncbi:hypothetical protein GCM10023192_00010 [Amycolatopsis samaneae]
MCLYGVRGVTVTGFAVMTSETVWRMISSDRPATGADGPGVGHVPKLGPGRRAGMVPLVPDPWDLGTPVALPVFRFLVPGTPSMTFALPGGTFGSDPDAPARARVEGTGVAAEVVSEHEGVPDEQHHPGRYRWFARRGTGRGVGGGRGRGAG